jgi:alginate O-acetyltransferase complex protein AlgI
VPMAFTTVLDFIVGRAMAARKTKRERRPLLLVSIVLNLSLLAYFKYSGLLVGTLNDVARIFGATGIAFQGLPSRTSLPAR